MSIKFSRKPARTRQDLKQDANARSQAEASVDPVLPGSEQTSDKLCPCANPSFDCDHRDGCRLGEPYVPTGTYKACGWCGSPASRYAPYKTKEGIQCSRGECPMSRLIFDVSEWENRGGVP